MTGTQDTASQAGHQPRSWSRTEPRANMSALFLDKQSWEPMELGGQGSVCTDQGLKAQCALLRKGQPRLSGSLSR